MWVVTNKGFASIVAHRTEKNVFIIRARNPEVFGDFFNKKEIVSTTDSDYRFRVFASKGKMHRFLSYCAEQVDYDNFKNSIKDKDVKDMAMKIWNAAYTLQTNRYGRQEDPSWVMDYQSWGKPKMNYGRKKVPHMSETRRGILDDIMRDYNSDEEFDNDWGTPSIEQEQFDNDWDDFSLSGFEDEITDEELEAAGFSIQDEELTMDQIEGLDYSNRG